MCLNFIYYLNVCYNMWFIKLISFLNLDIILNYMDNYLLELIILNRSYFSAGTSEFGIRATHISFAGALADEFRSHEYDFNNLIYLIMNFINNTFIMQTEEISQTFNSDYDFDEDYISDEDFNFSRYEFTNSEYCYDDTDWQYPSP